ncbi:hypothetical protein AB0B04_19620 [Streptomyces xinghaiensis]|uniref:Uncharacterized protein n=2 Tax=Streptomyces TaxID=1883 RepID=A0A3M8EWQ5_9ACTN|nr:hypothetical protein [Streptomyces xinghaiensis]PQM20526.1 hypothetical protein Sfr7A_25315 [Streptomyces xinghaiensis]RKM92468.1 hypothetical protein SFRA_023970 [Streptomyces xinghaiensis]RNC70435.1 hypothetical protein DC095_024960 [Streptomyces xinghaiensis]
MDVMPLPLYEVDVPIRSTTGLRGVHVFTGRAGSRRAAVRAAHEAYDAARAAAATGREVPRVRPNGWGARGYRPGWELDWTAATAGRWHDPYSWGRAGDCEL